MSRPSLALILFTLVVGCLWVSACHPGPGLHCVRNTDCPSALCDLSTQTCVADAGVTVDAGGCHPACPSFQYCLLAASTCAPRYAELVIVAPPDGGYVPATVSVTASLTPVAGVARADPPTLLLQASGDGGSESATLSWVDAGLYQGQWLPANEGPYVLTANWTDAGLVSGPSFVTVLKTPPAFVVTASLPDSGTLLRDALASVLVTSTSTHVDAGSVALTVYGTDGDAGQVLTVAPTSGCGQPYCGVAIADLSRPIMLADTATFPALVTGRDWAGNLGTGDAGLPVTRWRWLYAASPLLTAVAIGHTGNVYFGSAASGLYAVKADGTPLWHFAPTTSVVASPSVGIWDGGTETVYVAATKGGSGYLFAVDGMSGAQLHQCALGTGFVTPGLALMETSLTEPNLETAVAFVQDAGYPQFLAMRPNALTSGEDCVFSAALSPHTAYPPSSDTTVVVDAWNNDAYVAGANGYLESVTWGVGGWAERSNFPIAWNVSEHALGITAFGVFGAGTSGTGGALEMDAVTGAAITTLPIGAPAPRPFWNAVAVDSYGDEYVYTDEQPSLTFILVPAVGPAPTTAAQPAPAATIRGTVALGQGAVVWAADEAGHVGGWQLDYGNFSNNYLTTLTGQWNASLSGTHTGLAAAVSLDCARDSSGAPVSRPGVLYVPTAEGQLFSLVVDSHGLDIDAGDWPKYQHDGRNTGNQRTDLSEFACP